LPYPWREKWNALVAAEGFEKAKEALRELRVAQRDVERREFASNEDLRARWRETALREFVANEDLDVRRCILPGLSLKPAHYRDDLRELVATAVHIARTHPDEYIRHRVEYQVGWATTSRSSPTLKRRRQRSGTRGISRQLASRHGRHRGRSHRLRARPRPRLPAGPNYLTAVTEPDRMVLKLRTNGVEVHMTKTVFVSVQGEIGPVACPRCGQGVVLEDPGTGETTAHWEKFSDALDQWWAGESGLVACPHCQQPSGLNDWQWTGDWPIAVGFLGFTFWNWPALSESFIAQVAARLGNRVVVTKGKL
jgi:hypothetical protein